MLLALSFYRSLTYKTMWHNGLNTFSCPWEGNKAPCPTKEGAYSLIKLPYIKQCKNNQRPLCDTVPQHVGKFDTIWKYRSSRDWGLEKLLYGWVHSLVRYKGHPAEPGSREQAVLSSQAPCLGHRTGPQLSTSIESWEVKSPGPWAITHQLTVMFPLTECLGAHGITHLPSCPILPPTITGLHMPRQWTRPIEILISLRSSSLPWTPLLAPAVVDWGK